MTATRQKTERRRPRKAAHLAYVEYSKAGTRLSRLFRPDIKRGPMIDISEEGVQFRATEALDIGASVYMALHFNSLREPVKVKAEIRWVSEEKKVGVENYTHVLGARFVELTPHGWDLIVKVMAE